MEDYGRPMPREVFADAKIRYHAEFEVATRQVSIRNTGTETLWISWDHRTWFEISAGTSLDDRVMVEGFWYCTQIGETTFCVNGLQFHLEDRKRIHPTDEQKEEIFIEWDGEV
jgi:hypothetical protein